MNEERNEWVSVCTKGQLVPERPTQSQIIVNIRLKHRSHDASSSGSALPDSGSSSGHGMARVLNASIWTLA